MHQMADNVELIVGGLTLVFGTLGYFLKQKDAQQAHQIEMLFHKHDEDAKALQELRVQIAEGHYKKSELDAKFDKLEYAFKAGFDSLGYKFDKLSDVLVDHIKREDEKK